MQKSEGKLVLFFFGNWGVSCSMLIYLKTKGLAGKKLLGASTKRKKGNQKIKKQHKTDPTKKGQPSAEQFQLECLSLDVLVRPPRGVHVDCGPYPSLPGLLSPASTKIRKFIQSASVNLLLGDSTCMEPLNELQMNHFRPVRYCFELCLIFVSVFLGSRRSFTYWHHKGCFGFWSCQQLQWEPNLVAMVFVGEGAGKRSQSAAVGGREVQSP